MKRTVFGWILLLVLLGTGLLTQRAMSRIHLPAAQMLSLSGGDALDGDWETAEILLRRAGRRWRTSSHFSAALADHTPMEDIDGLFAQLEVFLEAREAVHYAALCAEAAGRLEAMADAHALAWWNLL